VRVHLTQAPLAQRTLHDLRPSDVEGYLSRTDLDAQTLRHHRATLRRALADALRDGLVTRNVAALAKPPLLPRRERQVLDLAQVGRLIDSTRGDRLHALWVIGATCGLREAEALGLRWSDVNLETGVLRVQYTLHYDPKAPEAKRWQHHPPKTAKSRRTINLPAETVRALRAHELIQADEIGDAPQPIDNLVFTTDEGRPIHGSNILPPLYRALRKAGLPKVTFHDLRHSAATVLYAAGVPLPVISDILGHSTIRVTNDLYRHRVPELSKDAASRMDAALERVMGDVG
jgi:integrase